MLIELRKGMTLHPGTFNAVIAPEKVMASALTVSADLQRFLYVSGRYRACSPVSKGQTGTLRCAGLVRPVRSSLFSRRYATPSYSLSTIQRSLMVQKR